MQKVFNFELSELLLRSMAFLPINILNQNFSPRRLENIPHHKAIKLSSCPTQPWASQQPFLKTTAWANEFSKYANSGCSKVYTGVMLLKQQHVIWTRPRSESIDFPNLIPWFMRQRGNQEHVLLFSQCDLQKWGLYRSVTIAFPAAQLCMNAE